MEAQAMRLLKTRSLSVAVVASLFVLAGAKGEGCGGGDETGGTSGGGGPEPGLCPDGYHLEEVCEVVAFADPSEDCHEPDPTCWLECVPDAVCPPDTYESLVCGGPQPLEPGKDRRGEIGFMPCDAEQESCVEPPPDECWIECVPFDSCGPGYEELWICEDPAILEEGGDDGREGRGRRPRFDRDRDGRFDRDRPRFDRDRPRGDEDPSYPDPCYAICVPACDDGLVSQEICEAYVEDGEGGGVWEECWDECVPEPLCPPGTYEEWSCLELEDEMRPAPCEIVCSPFDPAEPGDPGEPEPRRDGEPRRPR
jgi:hypothetical protein